VTAWVRWVRRVYDDRRYVDGRRHAVRSQSIATGAVTTWCGRYLLATTPAKAANRLVVADDSVPACAACERRVGTFTSGETTRSVDP
jgi:hypothetical protein